MKVEYTRREDGLYGGKISDVTLPVAFEAVPRRELVESICAYIKSDEPKRVPIHIDGAAEPIYLHGNTVKSIIEGRRTADDFIIGETKSVEEK